MKIQKVSNWIFIYSITVIALLFALIESCNSRAVTQFRDAHPNECNVCVLNKKMKPWFTDYAPLRTTRYYKKGEYSRSKKITLSWKTSSAMKNDFTVYVSTGRDMENSAIYRTTQNSIKLSNLHTDTDYYWKVVGQKDGKRTASETYHFKTTSTPRTINTAKVSNMRDIGGYVTETGKTIRQGKIFRSGNMDSIKNSGKKTILKQLGVKTDLDLRKKGEGLGGKRSPLGKKVKYIHISGVKYNEVWKSSKNKKRLVKEMKVFARKSNYPIVFHCIYGRDRTGTLAFMLNALLGCSTRDLQMDYEITFFSKIGNKSKITPAKRTKKYYKLYDYMRSYKDKRLPLSENVSAFLLDNGMKKKEIAAIKDILLK